MSMTCNMNGDPYDKNRETMYACVTGMPRIHVTMITIYIDIYAHEYEIIV